VETNQQTLAQYRNGLRGELYKKMLVIRLINVNEAYQLALRMERQLQNMSGKKTMPMDLKTWRTISFPMQKPQTTVDKPRSSWLGEQTERAKATTNGPQCYKCKGFGHYVMVCPTRDTKLVFICEKELTIMNEAEEEEATELTQEEEEQLGASELPSYVIRRVLTGNKKEPHANQEWMRTNIFHTRLEHGDRALNVIIDNDSGMNVISKTAIEWLKLKREKHPSPYRISWVNENNLVSVKHRCLVQTRVCR